MQEEIVKTFQMLYRIHKIRRFYWKRLLDSQDEWYKVACESPHLTQKIRRLEDTYRYLEKRQDFVDRFYLKKQKEEFFLLASMYWHRTGIGIVEEMPFYDKWTEFSPGKLGKFAGGQMLTGRYQEWEWDGVEFLSFTRLNSTD